MRRRQALAVGLFVVGAGAAAGALTGGAADAQEGLPPITVQAQASPAWGGATLIGSSPQGATGDDAEAWAYRHTRENSSRPGGAPLEFGPGSDPQLILLRFTEAEGWRHVETPVDEQGAPYRGGSPRPDGARVTPRGGLALMTNDSARPAAQQRVLLLRDRGARTRALPAPGPAVLLPAGAEPAERLSLSALGVTDDGDRASAWVGVEGPALQRAVAHWDGAAWSREPICAEDEAGAAPAGCVAGEALTGSGGSLASVAIAAAGGRAWLLARADADAGRGLVLFERVTDGGAARWRLRDLGLPLFESAQTPARGVAGVVPLPTPFALTATEAGVWIDGRFEFRGATADLTVFAGAQSGATTWCDPDDAAGALCDHPLGFSFISQGHRSFAWAGAGSGFGDRVITPLSVSQVLPYFVLSDDQFSLRQSFASQGAASVQGAAFGASDEGWIGPSHITRAPEPRTLAPWPVPVRRALTAITHAPGAAPGALDAPGLAVGAEGTVLRYTPGQGWDAESLLGSSGVARPNLRGVAWPSAEFAYAVGDDGAMWRWRAATGLWESDPGAPFDFQGHLMGVAFQPGNPERGYAVGRQGVLLRYDKSWAQEELPEAIRTTGPLSGPRDLTSVAFAGSQALVAAWTSVLLNDGAGWRVDDGAQALIDSVGGRVYAVAGLPDGGAVAAGSGFVIVRDAAGGPWRFTDQPLPGMTVHAAAAYRDGDRTRALVSVETAERRWPVPEEFELLPSDPGAPPPFPPPFSLPHEGVLLRETATGWRDEHRSLELSPSRDVPYRPDAVLAFAAGAGGTGWIAGGNTGWETQAVQSEPLRIKQTATIERYVPGAPESSPNLTASPPPTPAGVIRLAVGGHAQCVEPCAGLEELRLLPEQTLSRTVERVNGFATQANGPAALLYTGGRVPARSREPIAQADANRLAGLLGAAGASLPVFGAVAPADAADRSASAFKSAFAGSGTPFGNGASARATPVELSAPAEPGQARTHYAADLRTEAGTVRIAVIDNAGGSLAESDPHQNPLEPQAPWLARVLEDAKAKRIPVVVMGSLSLNTALGDVESVAGDATEIAALLREGGASAYVYDSPEAQRAASIPAGAQDAIPTFGSGSLGYGMPGFGVPGTFLLELEPARRDAQTNRAPAGARLIPVIDDLVLATPDGRLLNRSQPALFQGLGRRPRGGDALGPGREPSLVDPYVTLPDEFCPQGCAGLVRAEVTFASSDPDIADFVRRDPQSDNARKPFVDPKTDKPVADAGSGLLCAFNAGTTTVSIRAGGLAYAATVTVRPGSVLRPCGTIPLSASRFPQNPAPAPAAPPAPAPAGQQQPPIDPAVEVPIPPQPAQPAPAPVTPPPPARVAPPPPPPPPFSAPVLAPPATILPPPASSARPIPPSGTSPVGSTTTVVQPAARVQKEKEEEVAPEQQQSATRFDPDAHPRLIGGGILALVLTAAIAGASLRSRQRDRGRDLALSYARTDPRRHWRQL